MDLSEMNTTTWHSMAQEKRIEVRIVLSAGFGLYHFSSDSAVVPKSNQGGTVVSCI